MKTHDLRKLLEAVPYDFDVKVIGNCGIEIATVIKIDFEKKKVIIGVQ